MKDIALAFVVNHEGRQSILRSLAAVAAAPVTINATDQLQTAIGLVPVLITAVNGRIVIRRYEPSALAACRCCCQGGCQVRFN